MDTITETKLDIRLIKKGKVRDTYVAGEHILMIATDRLSAFDVVFSQGIPYKGMVLNQLSSFWFDKTKHIIDNHFVSLELPPGLPAFLRGRTMLVKKAKPLAIECVVRGYITGSAWKGYQKGETVCGIKLPSGLKNGDKLPQPIFTPSTKAEQGHDENITEEQAKLIVGGGAYDSVKETAIKLYEFARDYAWTRGLVLADTKFEFGYIEDKKGGKKLILIDEALTPDSSRYWVKAKYEKGILESLDKQFVRDYLETLNWDKKPPAPKLLDEVVQKTSERYLEAFRILTGKKLE